MSGTALMVVGTVAALCTVAFTARGFGLANDPLSDRADGDWPAVPDDLKVSHFGTDTGKRKENHARR